MILGHAQKIDKSESRKYFYSRPVESQIGAWVSPQSEVVSSREFLENKLEELTTKFSDKPVPFPDFWGGFKVFPTEFEFWQGRRNRLHDRFRYRYEDGEQENNKWIIDRLGP